MEYKAWRRREKKDGAGRADIEKRTTVKRKEIEIQRMETRGGGVA